MPPSDTKRNAGQVDGATPPEEADLIPALGANLRRVRTRRGLSLERLATGSGVSRAMLSQIELGRSTPTIKILWKICRALDLPFSGLISTNGEERFAVLRGAKSKVLTSRDGHFASRALFPLDHGPRRAEFYELRLSPGGSEEAVPHPPGTVENLVVSAGSVEIEVASERTLLGTGDSVVFRADAPHAYRNPGPVEAVMYLVMTYAEKVG